MIGAGPSNEVTLTSGKDGIQLAFTDVDIGQVIASVLGEALGLSYTIDPSVKGTMSLRSSRPLTPAELLPALEAALRLQDLVIVESRGTYAVIPSKDASHRVGSVAVAARGQAGYSVQVVPLQFIAATDMEKILQPLAPPGGVLRVDEARNLLLLAGTSQEQAGMLEVIKTFDVDWLAGMSYATFALNYVDARTAVVELSEIFADPKNPLVGVVRLVPLARLNMVLAITPQKQYLPTIESWIKRLDVGGTAPGRRIYVYDIQNGKAADLAQSLNRILALGNGGDNAVPLNTGGGLRSGQSNAGGVLAAGFASTSGPPVPTSAGNPLYGAATSAMADASANALDTGNLRIVPNDDSNSLLILATPSEFGTIEAALRRLDSPSRQVLIEASLAEVTLTDELRYGVQWSYQSHDGPIVLSNAPTGQISATFPGFSYVFTGSTDIRAALNALESITKVRVISSPKLVTLNNHEAQLQVGDQVPITTQSAVSVSTADAPIVNSVQYRDTGVILRVTPRVNKNGLVQLDIVQEVSDVATTTSSGLNSPTIQQRKLSSTVVVKNGDTIALGGLIRDNISQSKSGVPYLARIPLLGALFRDTGNTKNRTELILLITPHVMRDDTEFQMTMDDLHDEFKSLRPIFESKPPKP